MNNRITTLFGIKYPLIQGGMVWCSGWKLASAVSNCGGLGLLGAGSMKPDVLREYIIKTKAATDKPFGVNIPLFSKYSDQQIEIIIDQKVPVVFTSAGSPAKWTKHLKDNGIIVAHVVSTTKFAKKAEDAGVDAIVAEGFEAGGHNGREETTTLVLIPQIRQLTDLPLIAAGGIASGSSMLATMVLGAEGVQIGSLFAASTESSAHNNFKTEIVKAVEGSTQLALKQSSPVRLLQNPFAKKIIDAEIRGESNSELSQLLGKGRAKSGMFEGDLTEGELEIGQVSSLINEILPVNEIMAKLIEEYNTALIELQNQINNKYIF